MEMPDKERIRELGARARGLEPYTGDAAVCPKCLYPGANTEWLRHDRLTPETLLPECLARACQCCGFTWYEAVASPLTRALTADEAVESGAVPH